MGRKIRLSKNIHNSRCYFAVSDEVYDEIKKHRWYVVANGHRSHLRIVRSATAKERKLGYPRNISVHRWVMGVAKKGQSHVTIDHVNRDSFNNTFENLRKATHYEQSRNLSSNNNLTSLWGVRRNKKSNRYYASISYRRKNIYLGSFSSEEKAHAAAVSAYEFVHGKKPRLKHD